ncbi:MAG: ABC transporter substrate-binding protein [Lachnospiraceae bacterium]|nr:ABC transporter substrate-binding protein [Lachnospiraceae bacterium]
MRKRISALLGAAALALALAGCGSNSQATASAPSAAETTAAEAADAETAGEEETGTEETAAEKTEAAGTADTVSAATKSPSLETDLEEILAEVDKLVYENQEGQLVVSHKFGETVMPENPERIVSIKLEDLMLALDVDMVACRNFETFYLEDQINELGIGTITVDEEANTVNFEEVLSYKPDLIVIRDAFDQTIYDELSKIAPTIAFRLQDSRISLVALGRALGIEDKAVSRLGQYEKKIADAKEALSSLEGQQVAMLRILKKEIRLYPYSKNDMSSFLYLDLGLTPDPMVEEYDNADNLAISMEMLPELTADHIFLIAGYGSNTDEAVAEAKKRYDDIKADPLWQMVPAVQSGQVYEVDSRIWLTHGILATEVKIDDVLDALLPQ